MRVTIVGWERSRGADGRRPTVCAGYDLPGSFEFLNVAPQVIASGPASSPGEDWFAWWRRNSLDSTGGQLAVLEPRRASLEDWKRIFPGAFELRGLPAAKYQPSPSRDGSPNNDPFRPQWHSSCQAVIDSRPSHRRPKRRRGKPRTSFLLARRGRTTTTFLRSTPGLGWRLQARSA
jgi:hypothetical protein